MSRHKGKNSKQKHLDRYHERVGDKVLLDFRRENELLMYGFTSYEEAPESFSYFRYNNVKVPAVEIPCTNTELFYAVENVVEHEFDVAEEFESTSSLQESLEVVEIPSFGELDESSFHEDLVVTTLAVDSFRTGRLGITESDESFVHEFEDLQLPEDICVALERKNFLSFGNTIGIPVVKTTGCEDLGGVTINNYFKLRHSMWLPYDTTLPVHETTSFIRRAILRTKAHRFKAKCRPIDYAPKFVSFIPSRTSVNAASYQCYVYENRALVKYRTHCEWLADRKSVV